MIRTSFLIVAIALAGALSATAVAEPRAANNVDQHAGEPGFEATGITFSYVHEFALLPDADELGEIEVELGVVADGYVAPRAEIERVTTPIREIAADETVILYRSALEHIASALRRELRGRFDAPFFVAVNPRDIAPDTWRDRRPAVRRTIDMRIEYTGPSHFIDGFDYLYALEVDGLPPLEELDNVSVRLIKTDAHGYVAWRPGLERTVLTLGEIRERPTERYAASAIQEVLEAVRDHFTDQKYMAVRVEPDQAALAAARQDPTTLRLVVAVGVVTEIRTMASGERVPDGPERINHPVHERILERSPVQPGVPEQQLMRRDQLDQYIYRLSRHPGRRVDVAVAPAEEPQTLALDYIITENRPWMLYAQVSNTGTRATGRWRQRFGFFHTQLTNADDLFNVDYQTAEFSDTHAVTTFYERPLFGSDRVRWRINGFWNEFDASEVGFADLRFTGESYGVGGELIWNFFQRDQLFLDAVVGARYMNVEVENFFLQFQLVEGEEDFFLPYLGLRMERLTEKAQTRASGIFEFNIADVTDIDRQQLDRLGRVQPDRDWVTFQWDLQHSFFLEPLLNPEGWRDPTTPETSTLAHEIGLGFRGQYAFGNRLIPQVQQVAGGMFSVRGYPESVVAGDTVLIGTAEYRFHLPRVLGLQQEPGELFGHPFRWAPQHAYGRPDWDMIFRGFLDVGRTIHSDRRAFESDETLIGTGIGVELQYKRNLNLRMDWGIALEEIEDRVKSGSSRVHFSGTILF